MSTTTIRKVLISGHGDVTHLSVVDSSLPAPPPKHLQVRVFYSGFSGADINMRLGRYPLQKKGELTPGYCCVGAITALGEQCSAGLAVGDVVTALTVYDSEATAINIPEKYCVRVPRGVTDLRAAATLALDWSTAYGMVTRAAAVAPGQRVFIHGLSGAVGSATMALCRRAGAEVYGTASARNHAALRKLGVTPFVYTDKAWIAAMKATGGAHAVFDPLGFDSWDESFSILATGGILVGYGGNSGTFNGADANRSVIGPTIKLLARNLMPCSRTSFFYIARDQKTFIPELQTLLDLLARGEIQPMIKSVHDMEDIKAAHETWGKAPGMGSMVISVAPEAIKA